ncbi:MAG: GIY-YIG nuclease family protein [Bacteroidales bacterium]|nr:GIY-YIG nuclease family protein [Bacteroidales bacterium]
MENKILLNDLLNLSEEELAKSKIKFNQWNGYDNPMEEYKKNPEKINSQWLFWRTEQRYFYVGHIAICLLKLTNDTWLLTTIKEVTEELNIKNGVNYIGVELTKHSQYFGRVIIKYQKTHQTQGVYINNIKDKLEVIQILPTLFDGEDFPGYENVRLSYNQLEVIIDRNKRDWIASLENQKAVYLITDTNTGKFYVGSAYGDNGMLLQRWRNYAHNGHGGNVEFINLIQEKSFEYVKKYFVYTILENYNARTDKNIILKRESWWKETLLTKQFGYNKN